jgi:hypothetical protein
VTSQTIGARTCSRGITPPTIARHPGHDTATRHVRRRVSGRRGGSRVLHHAALVRDARRLDIGGYCASGGPYEISVQCPPAVIASTPLSIFGGIGALFLMLWGAASLGGSWMSLALRRNGDLTTAEFQTAKAATLAELTGDSAR